MSRTVAALIHFTYMVVYICMCFFLVFIMVLYICILSFVCLYYELCVRALSLLEEIKNTYLLSYHSNYRMYSCLYRYIIKTNPVCYDGLTVY